MTREEQTMNAVLAADPWAWAHYGGLEVMGGRCMTQGYEYQVEPLQSEDPIRVMKKATQLGLTHVEVIRSLHKCIYGCYEQGILYLFPTRGDVTDFSNSRFRPMINDNPRISAYVKDTDQANLKRVNNAFLYFRGARMAGKTEAGARDTHGLKSIPADAVVFDEFDEMPRDARPLAIARMENSPHKHETYLANPTVPDWGIDKMYQQSDQRVWLIRCNKCGKETCLELEFPNCLKKRRGKVSARGIIIQLGETDEVYRACSHCGGEIYSRDGHWVAQYSGKDITGWWMSHLMSVRSDMTQMLNDFHNPDTDLQSFYNLRLGMAYIAAENRLTESDVIHCCGSDIMDVRHDGPCGMGVDVGKIVHVVIGTKTGDMSRKIVKMARLSSFNDVMDLAKRFNVTSAVFDIGPETRAVREFAAAAPFMVYGCRYQESQRGVAQWDERSGTVVINRTEIFDATHNLVVGAGRLELPRLDAEVKEYAFEMCQTAKILEENPETGERKYFYRKLGPEHYRNATNYFELACLRLDVYSGGFYSQNPIVEKSGYAYTE